jgi:hypothetical protein
VETTARTATKFRLSYTAGAAVAGRPVRQDPLGEGWRRYSLVLARRSLSPYEMIWFRGFQVLA